MVRPTRLIMLCVSFAVSGCASLTAEVDVMDPAYVQDIRADLRLGRLIRESAGGTSAVESAIRGICTAYQAGRLDMYDVTISGAKEVAEPSQALQTAIFASETSRAIIAKQPVEKDCVKNRVDDQIGVIDRDLLLQRLQSIACPKGKCGDQVLGNEELREIRLAAAIDYQGLLDSYVTAVNSRLNLIRMSLGESITDNIGAAQSRLKAKIADEQTAAASEATDEAQLAARTAGYLGTGGRTLVLDQIAYAITKADKRHWADELNIAKGWGLFGSTDVVLKLESTGDFSVKGLVFDARSTASAARKATLSTLQILAGGSGLSFNPPTGSGDDAGDKQTESAATQASQSLAAAKASIAANEMAEQHYHSALRRIAAATIAAAENVEAAGDDQERKRARLVAKGLFEANKPLLQVQAGGSE